MSQRGRRFSCAPDTSVLSMSQMYHPSIAQRKIRGRIPGYFLRLGATGFGGPVALVARMRRDLVEQEKLISEVDFQEGLALAQVAPGPLAAQLAMYLGWVSDGARGATL